MAAKKKPSLVDNINRRKRSGTSRPKSRSTITPSSWEGLKTGWGKKKTKKKKTTTTKKKKTTKKKRKTTKKTKKQA